MPKINPVFEKRAVRFTQLVGEISPLLDKWIPLLGLDKWTIHTDYCAQNHETRPGSWACINCQWEYQTANLRLFLSNLAEVEPYELEKTVVHELCHCLVAPLQDDSGDHNLEELVVVGLTRVFLEFNSKIISKTLRKK